MTKNIIQNGNFVESRNGNTIEILNSQVIIDNPSYRCVYGNGRNINIFFLLQEAIWIWLGRKDVSTLTPFNENMSNFSDDGKTFHAPYGFRLRNYGIPSDVETFNSLRQQNNQSTLNFPEQGIDQIRECILMLSQNSSDRRVVANIWNPVLDLNFKCKDIPCNDMLMFKIRDEKLHLTIQNRSNDLHWGLPTNVFQFSFILEIMSCILGVEVGTQTHNSQSLHVYLDNPITLTLLNKSNKSQERLLPNIFNSKFDFNFYDFKIKTVEEKLKFVDETLILVFEIIEAKIENHGLQLSDKEVVDKVKNVSERSKYFSYVMNILFEFLDFKYNVKKNDYSRLEVSKKIEQLNKIKGNLDIEMLAKNFFLSRMKNKESNFLDL